MYQQLMLKDRVAQMNQAIPFHKSNICEEEPVDFMLNGKKLVTFMCTLQNLKELAIGHLYSRKIIEDVNELASLAACEDMRKIFGTSLHEITFENIELNTVLATNCGSGIKFNDKFLEIPKVESQFFISVDMVKELTKQMFHNAEMYKKIGGMHCAAISNGETILAQCEDVGRHNAVDKSIGKGLLLGVDFKDTMIITTGRISSDMILKAANISCPCIASRSIPTTLALEIADKLGITVIGRSSSNPIVYIHKERVGI